MIQVLRNVKPQILQANAETWTTEYLRARNNYADNPTPELKKEVEKLEKKYNHDQVKDALKSMFKKKCAFCESTITHIDYGQIEHFKPKSIYPDQCFEWNNFLLSCAICNGTGSKGNKFPLEAEGGPFINPTTEDPDDFFKFEYDNVLKLFIVYPKNRRAVTMLGIIKLNREDLAERRTKEMFKITMVIDKIIKGDQEKLDDFLNFFSDEDDYYAFIKTIIQKVRSKIF